MGRFARGMLILGVAACAGHAPALAPPSGPMPWFAERLGQPCAADVGWGGGFERCELGRISYVIRINAHYLVTGVVPGEGCCQWGVPCQDPGAGSSVVASPPLDFPRHRLVTRTLCRSGRNVDKQTVFVDGALLWIIGVYEVSINCGHGVIVIADRRLLSARDRESLREILSLAPEVDLDDDAGLERALRELPSLLPGAGGCVEGTGPGARAGAGLIPPRVHTPGADASTSTDRPGSQRHRENHRTPIPLPGPAPDPGPQISGSHSEPLIESGTLGAVRGPATRAVLSSPSMSLPAPLLDPMRARHLREPVRRHFPEDALVPETQLHLELRTILYQLLRDVLGEGMTVTCDQFVYWVADDPAEALAPDACVRRTPAGGLVRSWKVWERGAPEVAVEIVSDSDASEAAWEEKLARYRRLGVLELVRFDAAAASGQRLRIWDGVEGDLVERVVEGDRAPSAVLGLEWVVAPADDLPWTLRVRLGGAAGVLAPTRSEAHRAAEARIAELEAELERRGRD